MIRFKHEGNFESTTKFLKKARANRIYAALEKYGKIGVEALRDATPRDTGLTANSWSYEIVKTDKSISIVWKNSNIVGEGASAVPVAILIQYGHATRNGGHVEGVDYINPTLQPIFNEILRKVWKEVVD